MTMITSEDYVELAVRTDTPITEELVSRLTRPGTIRLLHAGMGMCTEAGEFLDMLKKHIFYGKRLDYPNAVEELGDEEWYIALAIDEIRTTMKEVLTINIEKLKRRYPEKFSEADAINRNVEAEREILNKAIVGRDCPLCGGRLQILDDHLVNCSVCGSFLNNL